MRDKREFDGILRSIDGLAPSEYGRLAGDFDFSRYVLHSLRIENGESETPTAVAVIHVPQMIAGFPPALFETAIRRTALEDYLTRRLVAAVDARYREVARSGAGAPVEVARPGKAILPRSTLIVSPDFVEARIRLQLPLRSGRIDADKAGALFFEDLPAIVAASLIYCYLDEAELEGFVRRMDDDHAIRQQLTRRGLVAFLVENGALRSDAALLTEIETPHSGRVRGVGIPAGLTLIVGDRHSGRPELLRAIAGGVYNQASEGEGLRVITVSDAVEIMAEPGRPVQRVDVRPFLLNDTTGTGTLTCERADALESQIASVMEAIEAGAQTLIADEALCAPDFLMGDPQRAALSPRSSRRYAALSERIRLFVEEARVSWVIGVDACASALMPFADCVLLLENGVLRDVTREAKALEGPATRASGQASWSSARRWIFPSSIDSARGKRDAHIAVGDIHQLQFGTSQARLNGLTQLAEIHQTHTIGLLLHYAKLHYLDESRTVSELLDLLDEDLTREGLDVITREVRGDLSRPRRYEIAAALNRLESLRIMLRGADAAPS